MATDNGNITIDTNPSGVNDAPTPGTVSIASDVNQPPTYVPPVASPKDIPAVTTPSPRDIPAQIPIISPKRTVPMFGPDGSLNDIPAERVHDAIASGGVIGSPIIAPDGTHSMVPSSRLHEALKAGAKIDSTGWTPEQEHANHPTVLGRLAGTVIGPGTIGEDVVNKYKAATPKGDLNAPYQSTGVLNPPSVITPLEAHQELSKPIVAPVNAMTPEEQSNKPELKNVFRLAGSLSSPENIAIMVGSGGLGQIPGPAGKLIGKALSAGWSIENISGALQNSPKFVDAMARGDENAARDALSSFVLGVAAAAPGVTHVMGQPLPLMPAPDSLVGRAGDVTGTAVGNVADKVSSAATSVGQTAADIAKGTGGIVKGVAKAAAGTVTQPIEAMRESPEERIRRAAGGSAGVNERDFIENAKRTLPYLVEENKTSKISTPEDVAEAAHSQKTNLWNDRLGGAHPGETIDGDAIAQDIKDGINTSTRRHFPEVTDALEKWADTFKGPYSLDDAIGAITDFNSKLRNFYKQSPSDQSKMATADPKLGMLQDAADSLRDHAFKKLEDLGEKNIPELRKDYGALNQLQRVFEKRAVVYGRQAPIDLKQSIGAIAAVASGHPLASAVPFITKYLNSPEHLIKSAVEKAGKQQGVPAPKTPPSSPAESAVNPT
jgi:hypothetical protein